MKKYISILLIGLFILSLTGCDKPAPDAQTLAPNTSEIISSDTNTSASDETEEIITEPAPNSINQLDTPNWGITFTAENVTPTSLTLCCSQVGGEPTGELQTGSYFVLEKSVNDTWEKVEYLPHEYDIAWTMEAWMIPTETTTEWDIKWEWLYGALPAGQYRIGKEIMDFRGPGNYDTAMHYAEFTID